MESGEPRLPAIRCIAWLGGDGEVTKDMELESGSSSAARMLIFGVRVDFYFSKTPN
jgi:hypothetical protein